MAALLLILAKNGGRKCTSFESSENLRFLERLMTICGQNYFFEIFQYGAIQASFAKKGIRRKSCSDLAEYWHAKVFRSA